MAGRSLQQNLILPPIGTSTKHSLVGLFEAFQAAKKLLQNFYNHIAQQVIGNELRNMNQN